MKHYITVIREPERKRVYISIKMLDCPKTLEEASNSDLSITIKVGNDPDEKKIIHFFYKKYSEVLKDCYIDCIFNIARNYKRKVKEFTFKNLRGSWGLCHPKLGKITLAEQLIHYRYEVQRYVIVHEVSHLVHQNHSTLFWGVVKLQCPDFKSLKKELKW